MWDLNFSQYTPSRPILLGLVRDPFKGSRVGFDTILECGFESNSTLKANSWSEGCLSLIYSMLALSLAMWDLSFSQYSDSKYVTRSLWTLCRCLKEGVGLV